MESSDRVRVAIGRGGAGLISLFSRHVVLPKSATESRIRSNADVYNFALDEDDMSKLDALDAGDKGAVTWNPVNAP